MNEDAPRGSSALIFAWGHSGGSLAALAVFVLISFGAHVATFFLFRIVYPEHVSIPHPAPRIILLGASRAENQPLLRWVEAQDPALTTASPTLVPAHLLEVPYRASYETVRTPPRSTPEPPAMATFLPARSPLEVIRSASPKKPAVAVANSPRATHLAFSGTLPQRLPAEVAPFVPGEKSTAPLEPALFLVGVAGSGEPHYIFPQASSGNPSMDAAAEAHLARMRFTADEGPITWGFATAFWGDDAYAPSPQRDGSSARVP